MQNSLLHLVDFNTFVFVDFIFFYQFCATNIPRVPDEPSTNGRNVVWWLTLLVKNNFGKSHLDSSTYYIVPVPCTS